MITSLTINGFKSLQSSQPLELGAVNVFIGANGSGKSNLLEAVGVLGAAASGRVDDGTLLRRRVRPGSPTLYKTSLLGQSVPRVIELEASGNWLDEPVTYQVSVDN